MGEEKDVGGGVDVDAVVQDDDGQKQNVDDGKSDETLKKIQINERSFYLKRLEFIQILFNPSLNKVFQFIREAFKKNDET